MLNGGGESYESSQLITVGKFRTSNTEFVEHSDVNQKKRSVHVGKYRWKTHFKWLTDEIFNLDHARKEMKNAKYTTCDADYLAKTTET